VPLDDGHRALGDNHLFGTELTVVTGHLANDQGIPRRR
jgi:hypothetical protein